MKPKGERGDWDAYAPDHLAKTVFENSAVTRLTYRSEDRTERFRVIVRQRPNPIGFTARLPGDRK